MGQALVLVIVFLGLLALLPRAIKWLQRRTGVVLPGGQSASRIVSAVAIGPQQKVVTVEVGPEGARVWLVLGVTGQNISCLHSFAAGGGPAPATVPSVAPAATTAATAAVGSFRARIEGALRD